MPAIDDGGVLIAGVAFSLVAVAVSLHLLH
jgi:hypothetical protein